MRRARHRAEVEQPSRERARPGNVGGVLRSDIRLVVPGQQDAEGCGEGSHCDTERHKLGDRPAPPTEGLGPGIAEGSGLKLTGQHH